MDAAWLIVGTLAFCLFLWAWETWADLRDARRELDRLEAEIDELRREVKL